MILPTKRVSPDRALLTVGSEVLELLLKEEQTVSHLWSRFQRQRATHMSFSPVTFDWFVLALDLLFSLQIIELSQGILSVSRSSARI